MESGKYEVMVDGKYKSKVYLIKITKIEDNTSSLDKLLEELEKLRKKHIKKSNFINENINRNKFALK